MPATFFRFVFSALLLAAGGLAAAQPLGAEQARQDAAILVNTMRTLHPALDKYLTGNQANAAFERFRLRAEAARSAPALYLAATELAAAIRCGHTWTNVLNQRSPVKEQLLETRDKLPFTLKLVQSRFLVLGSADPAVAAGDEILSVNGHSAEAMVALLMPYLRADGGSDGKRLRQLGHDRGGYSMMDILWPLLSPPVDGSYRVSIRRGGAARVTELRADLRAVTLAERAARMPGSAPPDQQWHLRMAGGHAVMTLPTFSMHRSRLDWRRFLAENFEQLARDKVKHLVIDIRRNEGGDGAVGLELMSYLIQAPLTHVSNQSVTTYERVPAELARHLQTWDTSFFDRSGLVDRIVDGPQAGRYSFRPHAGKEHRLVPQASRFAGKVWILIGPENSSATFLLAQLVKSTGVATLVGQPTGGNQRGLNGGQLAWVVLPASGVAVDIPLLATVYQADTPDAGIAPDLTVTPDVALQAAGRDQELEAVERLIGASARQ